MSLDNVVAIAAAAHGSALLIAFGLAISIPLIVFGSQIVLRFLNRFPILVVLGGGLLGWIAAEIMHLYVKRAKSGDALVGSASTHRARVADLIGL